jgi:AmmeMemoRadiSam system protein B
MEAQAMPNVRAPAVAGHFYSDDPAKLDASVEGHLDAPDAWEVPAKAIVAPHAGHIYSGPIAGTAYGSVRHLADRVRRIVLLGPAHRVPFKGIAAASADALATPLGEIPVDRAAVAQALTLSDVALLDAAFEEEHSLEVHLPFFQRAFGEVSVVPLLVGDAKPGWRRCGAARRA